MRKDVLIYLAGPLTAVNGNSVEQNVAQAVMVYMMLLEEGIPAFCPHLTAMYPSAWTRFSYDFWLAYDFAMIDRCTHMLMLPGWSMSKGASKEHAYAISKKMPIAHDLAELRGMFE